MGEVYIPRLRGFINLDNPYKISRVEIARIKNEANYDCLHNMVYALPMWNSNTRCHWYNNRRMIKEKRLYKEGLGINWDLIHGKHRKDLKFMIKKRMRNEQKVWELREKYSGLPGYRMAYARIGGGNWDTYRYEVETEPWFVEKVDDAFDNTYCYIIIKDV